MDVARSTAGQAAMVASSSAVQSAVPIQRREFAQATRTINDAAYFGENRELVFSFDRESHRPIVRLIDSRTKDVIRQIPPEYVLETAKAIDRTIRRETRASGR